MVVRFDPFRSPFADFDRVADSVFGRRSGTPLALDAVRRGDTYVISLDVPGVDPASIDLTADKNVLTIRAERTPAPVEGDEAIITERAFGSFERRLTLGTGLATDRIEARYDHGVLTITIPLAEAAKPRKVEVSVGAGTGSGPAIDAPSSEREAS